MKINFIFIFLITSLFAFSAMEKTSLRYSSDVSESDVEIEVTENDDIDGSDYELHFVKVTEVHYSIEPKFYINYINESFSLHNDIFVHTSINSIYYPQGPPFHC